MSFYTTVARYYDAENADKTDDIEFYTDMAEDVTQPILEIGVGSGRVALPLARAGHTVHGIDNNAAMLALARQRIDASPDAYKKLTLQEGDILTDEVPGGPFEMILLSYNMLMHFHQQSQQLALLSRLRRLVTDGGVVIIDLPNAGETFATVDTDAISLERTFVNPVSGHMVMQQAVSELDRATQFMRVQWIYDEIDGDGAVKRTVAPTVFRYYFPYEVQLLLSMTGFRVHQMLGDVDGSPFEDGCPRMVILAGPALTE